MVVAARGPAPGAHLNASTGPFGERLRDGGAALLAKFAEPRELDALLKAKVSVVSTTEELAYPARTHKTIAASLDALAKKSEVGLLATGVFAWHWVRGRASATRGRKQ